MFKYFLKKQFRNKSVLFWSAMFPVCLMLCFKFAFGSLYEAENGFDPVKAAYVNEGESFLGQTFDEVFESICEENAFFEKAEADTAEDGEKLLVSGDAHVLFIVRDGKLLTEFSEQRTDVDEIIVDTFLGSFTAQFNIIDTAAELNIPDFAEFVSNGLSNLEITKQKTNVYNETPDPYRWYYYSTFVMSILFQIVTGINIVADIQADVTPGAMRLSVSSEKKSKLLLASFSAKLLNAMLLAMFTLLIMRFGFSIPLGNHVLLLILLVFISEVFALSSGALLGLLFKGTVDSRENKATGILMASVFLSGEMVAVLPGIIEDSCPIINRINPATVMNFAFYRLAYYPTLDGFYMNMFKILGASVVFLTICVLKMRRQRYAAV